MRDWSAARRRWWPQPLLGAMTATIALGMLVAAWRAIPPSAAPLTPPVALALLCLIGTTLVAYQFPLHMRPKTKVYLASVPLYLLVVLTPSPLGVTAGGLATLIGEISVRRQRQTTAGDTASEVGRRILVLLLGVLIIRLATVAVPHAVVLVLVALALEAGDILSAPLVITPLSKAPPLRVIADVARAAWAAEGAQYLLGIVGALAMERALWAPALLVGPVALVYQALRETQQAHRKAEAARQEADQARMQAEEVAHILEHQVLHDALTSLPNRTLLHDRLEQALFRLQRDTTSLALLLLDLDRFKEVNDTLGHQAGDALLKEVAQRMRNAVRTSDTVARLGGDEFAVLLPGTDRAGAGRAIQTLLAAMASPILLEEHAVHVDASVGVALAPDHGRDAMTLLRCADVAMYVAKRAGSGYAVYDTAHDRYSPARLMQEAELRQALAAGELIVYYQPTVDLRSGRTVAVEALVRWAHPTQGLLTPDHFIPLAEQTGLIVPLTRWVLEQAIARGAAWARAGRDLGVAVNLSVRALHDEHLPDTLLWLLRQHALPPERLTLEMTETMLMVDPVQAPSMLMRLSALGVWVAIDDFGTGYSSLGHLKNLPVDVVKIDKAFVGGKGPTAAKDMAIARSIIELGHNLGLVVVAEGVEDAEAWEQIRALGADVVQGHYVSEPLDVESLDHWLDASTWGGQVRS